LEDVFAPCFPLAVCDLLVAKQVAKVFTVDTKLLNARCY
jgi:hypothetical protein